MPLAVSLQLSAKRDLSPRPPLLKERGRNTGKAGDHKGRPYKIQCRIRPNNGFKDPTIARTVREWGVCSRQDRKPVQ